jgi:hypothetical protein
VERGQLEAVRLLVQQGGRLQINRKTMTSHDTALCIAAREGSVALVRASLRHDQIDPNSGNRWCRAPLSPAAQRAHLEIVDALLVDGRLRRQSMITALAFAYSDPGSRFRPRLMISAFQNCAGQRDAGLVHVRLAYSRARPCTGKMGD